jgi:hypothetical protein
MNAEAILQVTWQLTRKHWRYLLLIAAMNFVLALILSFTVLVFGIVPTVNVLLANEAGRFVATLISGSVFVVLAALLAPILVGSAAVAALQIIKQRSTDPLLPYKTVLGQYRRLLPLTTMAGMVIIFGSMFLVVPGIIALVAFFVSVPIAISEELPLGRIITQSAELGRTHWVTILLLLLVIGAVSFALTLVLSAIPYIGSFVAGYAQSLVSVLVMLTVTVFYDQAINQKN